MRTFDSVEETSKMRTTVELTTTSHGLLLTLSLPCAEFPALLTYEGTLAPYHGAICLAYENEELTLLSAHNAPARAIPRVLTHLTGFNFGPTFLRMKREVVKAPSGKVDEEIELPDSVLEHIRSQVSIYFAAELEAQS